MSIPKRSLRGAVAASAVALMAATTTTAALAATAPKLHIRAATLTRVAPTTWRGAASSPQLGNGQLTLTGPVTFLPTQNADPKPGALRFRVTFGRGWLRGCIANSVFLRPGNRQVWDGPGRITSTSSSLRRYRDVHVHDGGLTPGSDLAHVAPFVMDSPVPARDAHQAPC